MYKKNERRCNAAASAPTAEGYCEVLHQLLRDVVKFCPLLKIRN